MIIKPLEVRNIHKTFTQGGQPLAILQGASYSLDPGMVVGLVGPSGSGKSTFLQIVGLLDSPDSGEVLINGAHAKFIKDEMITRIRAHHIGFVYQFHYLLPEFTALENVMIQEFINGVDKKLATEKAAYMLDMLQLSSRMHHLPSELSGGEQQRVAIARALVKSPALILADEPTGNLDPYNAELVFDIFMSVVKELNLAALIVTHNNQLALQMDAIITLKDGKIVNL